MKIIPGNFKILVVDDDPDLLMITERILMKVGYSVNTELSGPACLKAVEKDPPDLLLLDVMLGDMEGTEVCKKIKNDPSSKWVHVILVSGSKMESAHIVEGLETGADSYLTKPIGQRELLARVEAACRIIEAEKALAESELMFRSFFEQSNVAKSITRISGEINVNSSFCDLLGYEKNELLTKKWTDLTHPDDIQHDTLLVRAMLEGEIIKGRWEKRYFHKNGSIVHADVSSVLYHDQYHTPKYFITTVLDITQRKLAEQELDKSSAKFRSVFNSMDEGVALHELIFDDEGKPADYRIMEVNPAFTKHTGFRAADAIQKTAIELFGFPPPFLEKYAKVAISGKSTSFEVFYDKLEKHFSISVSSPLQNHFVTIFQDISTRKSYEQVLQEREQKIMELNQDLEKRVLERTTELTAANSELEAFAYTVSHDLRAPVRAIGSFTKILGEEYSSMFDAEGKRLFKIILDNTARMDMLIDDLLAFSRLSRTELNLTNISMSEIIWKCFGEVMEADRKHKVHLKLADLPMVKGDYSMLLQVWTNLLSNAVKYTSHCESPQIYIDCTRVKDEQVFSIRDNGTGFDMKYANKLFGVFQRLHTVKEYEGTGVGLAIVHRIIQRHNGRVWAEGEPGKGATFYFTLKP